MTGFLLTRHITAISSFTKFCVVASERVLSFQLICCQGYTMNTMWKVAAGAYKCGIRNFGKNLSLRHSNLLKSATAYSRTMAYMCSSKCNGDKFLKGKPATELCQCGCSGLMHTAGEMELVNYLKTEIVAEQKSQKLDSLPKMLAGFSITGNEAELEFKKTTDHETISINMNVSHSVDSDVEEGDVNSGEMKAKPNFEIDITRKNTTLTFSCSFVNYVVEEEKGDVFQIDEISLFEGKWDDKNYSVAGDILDQNLYDLFMTMLHEKGITNELIEDISEIATYYEHAKYVNLLQSIQKFASSN